MGAAIKSIVESAKYFFTGEYNGTSGNDTIFAANIFAGMTGKKGNIYAGAGDDNIVMASIAAKVWAGTGNDTVSGLSAFLDIDDDSGNLNVIVGGFDANIYKKDSGIINFSGIVGNVTINHISTSGTNHISLYGASGLATIRQVGYGDITSEVLVGNLKITKLSEGNIIFKGGAGYIDISKAGYGSISFAGAVGGININNSGGGNINFKGVGGNVKIITARGDVTLGAGAGNIEITNNGAGNIKFNGASGRVLLNHKNNGSYNSSSKDSNITINGASGDAQIIQEKNGDISFGGVAGKIDIKHSGKLGDIKINGTAAYSEVKSSAAGDIDFKGAGAANVINHSGKGNINFTGAGAVNLITHLGEGDINFQGAGAANVITHKGTGNIDFAGFGVANVIIHQGSGFLIDRSGKALYSKLLLLGASNTYVHIGDGNELLGMGAALNVAVLKGDGNVNANMIAAGNVLTKIGDGNVDVLAIGVGNVVSHLDDNDEQSSGRTAAIMIGGANVLTKKGDGEFLALMLGGLNVATAIGDGNAVVAQLGGLNVLTKIGNGDILAAQLGGGNILTQIGDGSTLAIMGGGANILTKIGGKTGDTTAALMVGAGNILTHIGDGDTYGLMLGRANIITKVGGQSQDKTIALMASEVNIFTHIGDGIDAALMFGRGNIFTKVGDGDVMAAFIGTGNIITHIGDGRDTALMLGNGANIFTKVGDGGTAALMISKANILTDIGDGDQIVFAKGDANIITKVGAGDQISLSWGKANIISHISNDGEDNNDYNFAKGDANIITKIGSGDQTSVVIGKGNIITHISSDGIDNNDYNFAYGGEANIITKVGDGQLVSGLINSNFNIITHIGEGNDYIGAWGENNLFTKVGDGNVVSLMKGDNNINTKVGDGMEVSLMSGNNNINTNIGDGSAFSLMIGNNNINTKIGDGTTAIVMKGENNLNLQVGDGLTIFVGHAKNNIAIKVGNGDVYGLAISKSDESVKEMAKSLWGQLKQTTAGYVGSEIISDLVWGKEEEPSAQTNQNGDNIASEDSIGDVDLKTDIADEASINVDNSATSGTAENVSTDNNSANQINGDIKSQINGSVVDGGINLADENIGLIENSTLQLQNVPAKDNLNQNSTQIFYKLKKFDSYQLQNEQNIKSSDAVKEQFGQQIIANAQGKVNNSDVSDAVGKSQNSINSANHQAQNQQNAADDKMANALSKKQEANDASNQANQAQDREISRINQQQTQAQDYENSANLGTVSSGNRSANNGSGLTYNDNTANNTNHLAPTNSESYNNVQINLPNINLELQNNKGATQSSSGNSSAITTSNTNQEQTPIKLGDWINNFHNQHYNLNLFNDAIFSFNKIDEEGNAQPVLVIINGTTNTLSYPYHIHLTDAEQNYINNQKFSPFDDELTKETKRQNLEEALIGKNDDTPALLENAFGRFDISEAVGSSAYDKNLIFGANDNVGLGNAVHIGLDDIIPGAGQNPNDELQNYRQKVSDHLPVLTKYKIGVQGANDSDNTLNFMSWNLQTLGYGDTSIDYINNAINRDDDLRPHIIALQEVMGAGGKKSYDLLNTKELRMLSHQDSKYENGVREQYNSILRNVKPIISEGQDKVSNESIQLDDLLKSGISISQGLRTAIKKLKDKIDNYSQRSDLPQSDIKHPGMSKAMSIVDEINSRNNTQYKLSAAVKYKQVDGDTVDGTLIYGGKDDIQIKVGGQTIQYSGSFNDLIFKNLGYGSGGRESAAFIYDSSKVKLVGTDGLRITKNLGNTPLTRGLLEGSFEFNNTEFNAASFHAKAGGKSKTVQEVKAVVEHLKNRAGITILGADTNLKDNNLDILNGHISEYANHFKTSLKVNPNEPMQNRDFDINNIIDTANHHNLTAKIIDDLLNFYTKHGLVNVCEENKNGLLDLIINIKDSRYVERVTMNQIINYFTENGYNPYTIHHITEEVNNYNKILNAINLTFSNDTSDKTERTKFQHTIITDEDGNQTTYLVQKDGRHKLIASGDGFVVYKYTDASGKLIYRSVNTEFGFEVRTHSAPEIGADGKLKLPTDAVTVFSHGVKTNETYQSEVATGYYAEDGKYLMGDGVSLISSNANHDVQSSHQTINKLLLSKVRSEFIDSESYNKNNSSEFIYGIMGADEGNKSIVTIGKHSDIDSQQLEAALKMWGISSVSYYSCRALADTPNIDTNRTNSKSTDLELIQSVTKNTLNNIKGVAVVEKIHSAEVDNVMSKIPDMSKHRIVDNDNLQHANPTNDNSDADSTRGNIQIQIGDGEFTTGFWGENNLGLKIGSGGFKAAAFGENNVLIHIGDAGSDANKLTVGNYDAFEGAQLIIGDKNLTFNYGNSNDFIVMTDKSIPLPPFQSPFSGPTGIVNFLKNDVANLGVQANGDITSNYYNKQNELWDYENAQAIVNNVSSLDNQTDVAYDTLFDYGSENKRTANGVLTDIENTANKKFNQWIGGGAGNNQEDNSDIETNVGIAGQGADIILSNGNNQFFFGDNVQSVMDTTIGSLFAVMLQDKGDNGMSTTTFTYNPANIPGKLANQLGNNLSATLPDLTLGDIFKIDYAADGKIIADAGYTATGHELSDILETLGQFGNQAIKKYIDPQGIVDNLKSSLNLAENASDEFMQRLEDITGKNINDTEQPQTTSPSNNSQVGNVQSSNFGFAGLQLPSIFNVGGIAESFSSISKIVEGLTSTLNGFNGDVNNMKEQMMKFFTDSGYMVGDSDLIVSLGDKNYAWGGHGNDIGAFLGLNNNFWGGKGDDLFYGLGENNQISGNEGNDTGILVGLNNIFFGGEGDDFALATGRNNNIAGNSGQDKIFMFGADGLAIGGDDDDYIVAVGNFNSLQGGNGSDYIVSIGNNAEVNSGNDNDAVSIFGNKNNVSTGQGSDMARIFSYQSTIATDSGNDFIIANVKSKNNDINAGDGADILELGGYMNKFSGGDGNDLFVVNNSAIHSQINDIKIGDKIVFDGLDYRDIWFGSDNNDLIIYTNRGFSAEQLKENPELNSEKFGEIIFKNYFLAENQADIALDYNTNSNSLGFETYSIISQENLSLLIDYMSQYDPLESLTGFYDDLSYEDYQAIYGLWRDTTIVIKGNDNDNKITDTKGNNMLTGGQGSDIFIFSNFEDNSTNQPDIITDFKQNEDKINLHQLELYDQITFDQNADGAEEGLSYHFDNENNTIIQDAENDFHIKLIGKIDLNNGDFEF